MSGLNIMLRPLAWRFLDPGVPSRVNSWDDGVIKKNFSKALPDG
jgi:hypothetical protein